MWLSVSTARSKKSNRCTGSAPVRRTGVSFAAFGEILGGGEITKRLVGPDVIEVIGEAIDLGL